MKQFWFVVTMALTVAATSVASGLNHTLASLAVRIKSGDSALGSGFYLESGSGTYLITAKHVLVNTLTGLPKVDSISLVSYGWEPLDTLPVIVQVDIGLSLSTGNMQHHEKKDVLVIRVATADTSGRRSTPGVYVPGFFTKSVVPMSHQAMFDSVVVGREAFVTGYPSSLESKELDFRRPLVRSGIIAGKNLATKMFFTDCAVTYGNSGGPVIQSRGRIQEVVGVAVQLVGDFVGLRDSAGRLLKYPGNSGYSVVVPMDFVLELLSQWEPTK